MQMLTRLLFLVLTCIALPALAADEVRLQTVSQVDALRRIGVSMEVSGHLLVNVEGKEQRLPMQVKAVLRHQERLLSVAGSDSEVDRGRHSVRYYDDLEAKLNVDGKAIEPTLRDDRELVTVTIANHRATMTGLYGPLSREELDLLQLPADSLILERLLPGDDQPRSVDAKWKPDADTMALLLRLDAVGSTDVESTLFELTDELAKVEMKGTVHGALDGIATKIELRARYYFDRQQERITGLEMHFKEKRAAGHVAPGVDVTARIKLHVTPLEAAPMLMDEQLEGLAVEARTEREPLEYLAMGGRIRFMHDRRWHVTQEAARRVTMRLIDDGELIAQCNLVEQKPMKEGSRVSLDEFQQDIRRVLGEKFGNFRRAKESMDSQGNIVYEIQAEGRVADMPIQWIYYLISAKDGRRVSLVFTMEAELVEKFEHLDTGILASLELLESTDETPVALEPEASTAATTTEGETKGGDASAESPVDRSAEATTDDGPALR